MKWCTNTTTYPSDNESPDSILQRRLESLLLDLKLIASTLFGVKPSSPRLENTLIREIFRRYNSRFPPSELAKRGPVETVWYVVPSSWWRKWGEKYLTGRVDQHGRPYILPPIDNDKLLVDNGSLALRPGLRNKHDFEVRFVLHIIITRVIFFRY